MFVITLYIEQKYVSPGLINICGLLKYLLWTLIFKFAAIRNISDFEKLNDSHLYPQFITIYVKVHPYLEK